MSNRLFSRFFILLFSTLFSGLVLIPASHEAPNGLVPQREGPTIPMSSNGRPSRSQEGSLLPLRGRALLTGEREDIVSAVLSGCNKGADACLLQHIITLTEGYDEMLIRGLVLDMANNTEGVRLDSGISLNILGAAVREHDGYSERTQRRKLAIIERFIAYPPVVVGASAQRVANQSEQYPLLRHVYQVDAVMKYFQEMANQLRRGRFDNSFRRGVLLYGPPGVGKTQMVKALINESGCKSIKKTASGLVTQYQGSGARAIMAMFAQARREQEPNKGTLIFIDELQSLVANERGHEDLRNTLTQIWTELDACEEGDDHILVMAACNEFERIDERIRGRFKCIEFARPDDTTLRRILIDKANYYGLPISAEDTQRYHQKMRGWSGREVTQVVRDAKSFVSMGTSIGEALQQSFDDQAKARADANPGTALTTVKEYAWIFAKEAMRECLYRGLTSGQAAELAGRAASMTESTMHEIKELVKMRIMAAMMRPPSY